MKKLIVLFVFLCSGTFFADSVEVFSSVQLEPSAIHMVDNAVGYICGSGGISRTNDFGESWYHYWGAINVAETTNAIYDFQFLTNSTAYAVGWRGTPINDTLWEFNNVVIKSTNQGIDWFDIMSAPIGKFSPEAWKEEVKAARYGTKGSSFSNTELLFAVYSFNSQQIVVSGNMSKVYTTSDGGANWQQVVTGWNTISRFAYNKGILYGLENNQIGLSSNYGMSWSLMPQAPGCFVESIFFQGNNRIFTAGTNGYTLSTSYTTDNGTSWHTNNLSDSGFISDMIFLDDNLGYATAAYPMVWGLWNYPKGYILKTSDGGASWSKIFEQQWIEMHAMCKFEQYLFFVGMGRVARLELKVTSIQQTGTELPKEFKLKQNYPNPFNPNTNIHFSVTKTGRVIIKVFDIAGREVTTLSNEMLSPGTYKVDFNASNLTSGIYFYRMTAGEFTETKKMILIK